MMLVPVCRVLQRWKFPLVLASFISVFGALILLLSISYLLINQLVVFGKEFPTILIRLDHLLESIYQFNEEHFQFPLEQQKGYFKQHVTTWSESAGKYAGGFLIYVVSFLANILIVTTYTVLILIYRRRIKRFVQMIVRIYTGKENLESANKVVEKITGVASSYLAGVFSVVLILSVVYTIGLMIIGVENALFFALLAALINVIPYLGSVGGAIIVVAYTLITRDTISTSIAVALFFAVIQQVDSYYLTPKITGSQVQLSPLFTIMALLLGALVWGIAGMILFIPFMGVLKVIFDEVDHLRPFGYLIGDR